MSAALRDSLPALRRWRESATRRDPLDGLLSRAEPGEPFEGRLQWLASVLAGVGARDAGLTRLQHLLNVLDNPGAGRARDGPPRPRPGPA